MDNLKYLGNIMRKEIVHQPQSNAESKRGSLNQTKAGSQKPWDRLHLPDGWHPFQEHMLCSQGRQDWVAANSEKAAAPGPL